MFVKICGIKDKKSLLNCIKFNIMFLGFVFYKKSKRYLKLKKAIKLFNLIPINFIKVGVFVNPTISYFKKITTNLNINLIQYSGEEKKEYCNYLYKFNRIPWIKVNKYKFIDDNIVDEINSKKRDLFFLDFKSKLKGGSGKTIDLKFKKKIRKKIIISGGININNLEHIIYKLNPFCVDISSGVEKNGIKDFFLIKKLYKKINETK
ncbi:phosphoribosylanthranilate isomerase [Candidatus Vidania fulgoroideorum]